VSTEHRSKFRRLRSTPAVGGVWSETFRLAVEPQWGSATVLPKFRAGKNLGFLEIFFIGFLGFNVHNAEYRYMTHDK